MDVDALELQDLRIVVYANYMFDRIEATCLTSKICYPSILNLTFKTGVCSISFSFKLF